MIFQIAQVCTYLYIDWLLFKKLNLFLKACGCSPEGSVSLDCNKGICTCKEHFTGDKCDECAKEYRDHPKCDVCASSYFGLPDCQSCSCYEAGSKSLSCHQITGECDCKDSFTGEKCDQCEEGTYGYPLCKGKYQSSKLTILPFKIDNL